MSENKKLRLTLLDNLIPPKTFVIMEEKEFANDELIKKRKEAIEYNMAAKRTDAMLEHELKHSGDSIYTCGKCKSRRVHCRT